MRPSTSHVIDLDEFEYELIFSPDQLDAVFLEIQAWDYWALDFETTALSPDEGKVRLTSLCNGHSRYLFDHNNCGSFESMAHRFIGPTYIAFSSGFEYKWFDDPLPEEVKFWDVQFMRKATLGGIGGLSLARMCKMDLNIELDKSDQASDWSAEQLTEDQLAYGAYDAYVTWELYVYWKAQMNDGHWNGFHVINDAVRGNMEMEDTGLWLDVDIHAANIKVWTLKRDTAKRYFERFTPPSIIKNINSRQQMSNFLKAELHPDVVAMWPKTASGKDLSLARETITKASLNLPYPMNRWLIAFTIYHYWAKYTSTYGETLITKQKMAGKLTYRLNMAAAKTGRYSSSSFNIQNIPKKWYIRRAFQVNPLRGEKLLLADYSGVEVRTLAEVSGDEQLKEDCIYGNVHAEGAALINGIDADLFLEILDDPKHKHYDHFKYLRGLAKVFTFRLTYGAGVDALAASLKKPVEVGRAAAEAWAERYPNAYNYRFRMMEYMNVDGKIPVVDGRQIYVVKPDRIIPIAANYPIQAAAASVMYRAVYRTRNNFIQRDLSATLAATVHDELLSLADIAHAERGMEAQVDGMTQGWTDIFPGTSTDNLLEYAIGDDWGCKI